MKLVHSRIETHFDGENINVLAVENAEFFRTLCNDMRQTIAGEDESFVLSDDDNPVNLSKRGLLIFDPLVLDANERKIITKLYAELVEIADEKFLREAATICDKFSELFDKLNSESSVQLDWFNDSPITALLKAFGVVVKSDYDGYAEKLVNYVSAVVNLCGICCVTFVNLKSYFSERELSEIYKFFKHNGIFVLLLESAVKPRIDEEFRVIIDSDLCEIIA